MAVQIGDKDETQSKENIQPGVDENLNMGNTPEPDIASDDILNIFNQNTLYGNDAKGSVDLTKLKNELDKLQQNNTTKYDVVTIDPSIHTNYPCGIVALGRHVQHQEKKAYCYSMFIIADFSTGNNVVTSDTIASVWGDPHMFSNPNNQPKLKLLATLDTLTNSVTHDKLNSEFNRVNNGALVKTRNISNKIVTINNKEIVDVAKDILFNADINAKIYKDFVIIGKHESPLNPKVFNNVKITFDPRTTGVNSNPSSDGFPYRGSLFGSLIASRQNNNNNILINANDNTSKVIASGLAYVELIPSQEMQQHDGFGPPRSITKCVPSIVVSKLTGSAQTAMSVLLNIAAMSALVKPDIFVKALAGELTPFRNLGALEKIINSNGDANPTSINLLNAKITDEEKLAYINKITNFKRNVLSLDLDIYGDDSYIANAFLSKGGLNHLKAQANILTMGRFGPVNDEPIILGKPIFIPKGTYTIGNETLDLRHVDGPAVVSKTQQLDPMTAQLLIDKAYGTATSKNNEYDPYVARTELYHALKLENVQITSKFLRVTFDPTFINKLVGALAASGFVPSYKPLIQLAMGGNVNYLDNVAAVQGGGTTSFGINNIYNSNNFGTTFGNGFV